MRPPVFVTLRRSKILAHRFVYPTDAEPDLDFPASVPSWDCGVESIQVQARRVSVLVGEAERRLQGTSKEWALIGKMRRTKGIQRRERNLFRRKIEMTGRSSKIQSPCLNYFLCVFYEMSLGLWVEARRHEVMCARAVRVPLFLTAKTGGTWLNTSHQCVRIPRSRPKG